jgi:hypothetical protein
MLLCTKDECELLVCRIRAIKAVAQKDRKNSPEKKYSRISNLYLVRLRVRRQILLSGTLWTCGLPHCI